MAASNPVRRIAAIVDAVALARGRITLAEIANHVRLPLSTVHRTVSILVDVGYLSNDPSDKTYRIGDRLKRALLLTFGTGSLEELIRPTLIDLAERFTETAYAVRYTASGPKLVDF